MRRENEPMECIFTDISEHDMDMLFLEEFVSSTEFLEIFTKKVKIGDSRVISVHSSKTDTTLGESDITVVVESDGKRIGLLIEDKIDAIAMPNQADRYQLRGEKGVNNGDYDDFHVFIIAPKRYLEHDSEASKYPNKVKYETVLDYFAKKKDPRSFFKAGQIKFAIEKQKNPYQPIEDERVTSFWKEYSEYQKHYYPDLNFEYRGEAKGTNARWFMFRTNNDKLYILHKTNHGHIDLCFDRCGRKLTEIENLLIITVDDYLQEGYTVRKTGKTAVIRLFAPVIDVHEPFDNQQTQVEECFRQITRVSDLAKQMDKDTIDALF